MVTVDPASATSTPVPSKSGVKVSTSLLPQAIISGSKITNKYFNSCTEIVWDDRKPLCNGTARVYVPHDSGFELLEIGAKPAQLGDRVAFLRAFTLDDVLGRTRRELDVAKLPLDAGQKLFFLSDLLAQPLTLDVEVDHPGKWDEHLAATDNGRGTCIRPREARPDFEVAEPRQPFDVMPSGVDGSKQLPLGRHVDDRRHFPSRRHIVFTTNVADGGDEILHRVEHAGAFMVGLGRISRRPCSRHDGFAFLPRSYLPPQLLGDERHERVQQKQHPLININRECQLVFIELLAVWRLDQLEVPVAVVLPEQVVDVGKCLVEPVSRQCVVHGFDRPVEPV